MALLILVGRRSVSHSPSHCDLATWQSIKEWHMLRLVISLSFWVVETVDGAITSSWLVVLSQQSIDALNSYEQLLLDKNITIRIVLFITILQTNKRYHVCHNRFMKFKMNRYHSKNDVIHRNRWKLCLDVRLLYIFAHNSTSRWVCYLHWKFERNLQTSGKITRVYIIKKWYCRKLRRQAITSIKVKRWWKWIQKLL